MAITTQKYIPWALKVDWGFIAIFGWQQILLLLHTSTCLLWKKIFCEVSKGSQLIPNVHFYANFLLCFALVLTIVLQMTWNRTEILLSHNRFYSCSNAIQILLQPASGVLHFWVSLHLHVIHTLKMYILSLNQFISVHERHFLEILCYSFWFMMYFMEDIF